MLNTCFEPGSNSVYRSVLKRNTETGQRNPSIFTAPKVLCYSPFRNFSHPTPLTLTSESGGVRRVTLNNPSKRNALSLAMIEKLHEAILKNVDAADLRCIVIDHNGPVFSSGHDLKELASCDRNGRLQIFERCSELMVGLRKLPIPVIATINGVAAAAGCQLVASCDISVASDTSEFSTPGASVGLFCSTPGVALVRNVPLKAAAYMLLTGNRVSATEALLWGLVSKTAKEEELDSVVSEIVCQIVAKSRPVIALGKKFFYEQMDKDLETAYRLGSEVMVANLSRSEASEGIQAFFQKRTPKW